MIDWNRLHWKHAFRSNLTTLALNTHDYIDIELTIQNWTLKKLTRHILVSRSVAWVHPPTLTENGIDGITFA